MSSDELVGIPNAPALGRETPFQLGRALLQIEDEAGIRASLSAPDEDQVTRVVIAHSLPMEA